MRLRKTRTRNNKRRNNTRRNNTRRNNTRRRRGRRKTRRKIKTRRRNYPFRRKRKRKQKKRKSFKGGSIRKLPLLGDAYSKISTNMTNVKNTFLTDHTITGDLPGAQGQPNYILNPEFKL